MDLNKIEIPSEVNAEILTALLSEQHEDVTVKHEGVFYRNYQGDVLDIHAKNKTISISRDSLYHQLPQALFHRIDVFRGITGKDFQDKFKENWDILQKEKETALNFFAPFDNAIFSLKTEYQNNLNKYFIQNSFFCSFILDNQLVNEDTKNPYIQKLLVFLPYLEAIRGNKTKLKLILRWILGDTTTFETHCFTKSYTNNDNDNYTNALLETSSDELFCNNQYEDTCFLFLVKIQQTIDNINNINEQEQQLEEFKLFFQHYFMSLFEELEIRLGDFEKRLILDDSSPVFLGYNTQI